MSTHYIFTSESVTEGHPDKLCDQISDALVGDYLLQDQAARAIVECAVSTGILFVSVKATSSAIVDVPNTARKVILDVGYDRGDFNGYTCTIMTNQSELPHLPTGNSSPAEPESLFSLVAMDNVTAFGFACTQTPNYMPLTICLAHQLVRRLDAVRKGQLDYLAPDGSCQVAVEFDDYTPVRIHSITLVASQQKKKRPHVEELRADLHDHVIAPVFADEPIGLDERTRVNINPEGCVVMGGPALHAGLTGRKNGIDTYGGYSRQSGAALSGKDPSRIDRVGAYAARHLAKNIVAAGLCEQCEIQLSYSIGQAAPVSVRAESFGTGQLSDNELSARVRDAVDLRLGSIIQRFDLRTAAREAENQFYRRLAVYGHVGRDDLDLPWERLDLVAALQ